MAGQRPPLPPFTAETAALMSRRGAGINDVPIAESERTLFGPRAESER
ncbi:hypothetical protein [Streptomyces sp. NRRL B-24572]|nr:hypothetical protein [Streptomyces sp. NRRL B-24572]